MGEKREPSTKFLSLIRAMNRLPEVTWDRCCPSEEHSYCSVFGWIAREDGRFDFIVLFTYEGTIWFNTSSARYSREFGERLFGTAEGHRDCQRVEDVFGDLVERKVKGGAG